MSERQRRKAAKSWQRTNLGTNGYMPSERQAELVVKCPSCSGDLGTFARHMDPEYDNGPLSPDLLLKTFRTQPHQTAEQTYSLDCARCGAVDLRVTWARIMAPLNLLHARCLEDDTPRRATLTA